VKHRHFIDETLRTRKEAPESVYPKNVATTPGGIERKKKGFQCELHIALEINFWAGTRQSSPHREPEASRKPVNLRTGPNHPFIARVVTAEWPGWTFRLPNKNVASGFPLRRATSQPLPVRNGRGGGDGQIQAAATFLPPLLLGCGVIASRRQGFQLGPGAIPKEGRGRPWKFARPETFKT